MCGPSYLEAVLMNSGNVVLESTGKWKWREVAGLIWTRPSGAYATKRGRQHP